MNNKYLPADQLDTKGLWVQLEYDETIREYTRTDKYFLYIPERSILIDCDNGHWRDCKSTNDKVLYKLMYEIQNPKH